ncbi:hypothetical protein BT69DRAFT_1210327 [Atractiella rhizophila]|nr:hypothetical protein BT69DRAFT_1210327 [Atractiella rhizophila]
MQSRQQRQVLSLPCASISFNFLLSISPACSSSYKSSDFHVITANTTRAGGNLSRLDVDLSILALNNGFSGTGLQFELASLDYSQNSTWFLKANTFEQDANGGLIASKEGAQIDYEMKTALRVGEEKDLNVYTVAFEGTPSLLGYSAFPEDYEDKPIFDGVLIHYRTTPGGGFTTADQGKNLVHEVGHCRHWVGLFHPFQGSCDDLDDGGDMVDDTPPELEPTGGCPVSNPPKTCPGENQPSSIFNYMSYTFDACKNPFTPGQITRLRSQLDMFRGIEI